MTKQQSSNNFMCSYGPESEHADGHRGCDPVPKWFLVLFFFQR